MFLGLITWGSFLETTDSLSLQSWITYSSSPTHGAVWDTHPHWHVSNNTATQITDFFLTNHRDVAACQGPVLVWASWVPRLRGTPGPILTQLSPIVNRPRGEIHFRHCSLTEYANRTEGQQCRPTQNNSRECWGVFCLIIFCLALFKTF